MRGHNPNVAEHRSKLRAPHLSWWWAPLKTMGRTVMGPPAELEEPEKCELRRTLAQARLPLEPVVGKQWIHEAGK